MKMFSHLIALAACASALTAAVAQISSKADAVMESKSYNNSVDPPSREQSDPRYVKALEFIGNKKYSRAKSLLTQLSSEGSISAKLLLGKLLSSGEFYVDYPTAFRLFEEAAADGDSVGEFDLGVLYRDGKAAPKSAAEAVRWFSRAADQDNTYALDALAIMYQKGEGVPKDDRIAVKLAMRAAEAGLPSAQNRIGQFYEEATGGLAKSLSLAFGWYKESADQNFARAKANVARFYENGLGVPIDYNQSFLLYKQAADQNDMEGEYGLSIAYRLGKGVHPDQAEAMRWLRRAADQGEPEALFNLGAILAEGKLVQQDKASAVYYYQLSANKGYGGAQFNLGFAYGLGLGVPVDPVQAYEWFALSIGRKGTADSVSATKNRDYAASFLTPEQLAKARRYVLDWEASFENDASTTVAP